MPGDLGMVQSCATCASCCQRTGDGTSNTLGLPGVHPPPADVTQSTHPEPSWDELPAFLPPAPENFGKTRTTLRFRET